MHKSTKMDQELWAQYKKNADIFRQRIDDICEKYANVEDPGFDLCLDTMTYKTQRGPLPADSAEVKRKLKSLQDFADKNAETLKDVNNSGDTLVTYGFEDEEKDHGHHAPVMVMENLQGPKVVLVDCCKTQGGSVKEQETNPGPSLLETSQVTSSLLSLPEEQDPELERTFSSHSDTSTLQNLYPSMLTQIHQACQRQQASNAASSLRRKYQRQRWKAKRLNPGQSFNVSGPSTTFQTQSVAPKGYTEAHIETHHVRDAGSGLGSYPWKGATSQSAAGQVPVRVMDFSTPPSSGPSSPSDSDPDMDQTYVVTTSPPAPHTSQYSEQQFKQQQQQQQQQQQVNNVLSLYPNVGGSRASKPVTGLCNTRPHTQVFSSPKRRNYESSLSSPSKGKSVLKSPSHHHHDRSMFMEYSPPRKELSSPRRFPYTQNGRERQLLSREVPQGSPSRSGGDKRDHRSNAMMGDYRPYKPRNLSRKIPQSFTSHSGGGDCGEEPSCRVVIGDNASYKPQFLSREASEGSPSKASCGRHSFIHHSPYSSSSSRLSPQQRHPEVYTSPSHRHQHQHQHHHRDLQENLRPSPSKLQALQKRRWSFSAPQDSERSPARRLSSSIRHVNQQFRQLYHQHICQRSRSSSLLSHHSSSCCLCEQRAEGCSPSSRASSVTTPTAASASTDSRLAALSLTPVRRRRFQSKLSPLLKRLQRGRQVSSSLLHRHRHQKQDQHQQQPLYSAHECDDTTSVDTSEMFDDGQSPDLYHGAPINSGSRYHHHHHHHHHNPTTGSSSNYSSSTLAALGLAPTHSRLSKRRCLSEPKESPSLKRFRESTQPQLSPSKSRGFPQHQRHQQWEGNYDEDNDDDAAADDDEDMMAPVRDRLSEEHLTRSRALLLQCPSPRFLRAAMRLMKAGGGSRPRARPSLGVHPHASTWGSPQDHMQETEEMPESWNESGLSPSLSRRRLLYGVPRC